jgi:hypothetical protein
MQSVSNFLGPGFVIVNIRRAGAYYPFSVTPSLEPEKET